MNRKSVIILAPILLIVALSIAQAQQEETFSECNEGNIEEPVLLNYGNHTRGCAVDTVGDTDTFVFDATAGDTVLIGVSETTSRFLEPTLRVLAPSGQELVNTAPGGNILQEIRLDETGTYLITVRDNGANDRGGYVLQLERVPPINPPPPHLPYDMAVRTAVSPISDIDIFAFSGANGTRVQFTLSETTSRFIELHLRVLTPSGQELINIAPGGNIVQERA